MWFLFPESITSRNAYLTFLRNIVGETVVRYCDLSLKKSHKPKKKKKHPFLQKEALLKCESVFKPKSPVRNTLYFYPNNSSLSWDNAVYIALESIKSPWWWQRFLLGTLETVSGGTTAPDPGLWPLNGDSFPAWTVGKTELAPISRLCLVFAVGLWSCGEVVLIRVWSQEGVNKACWNVLF